MGAGEHYSTTDSVVEIQGLNLAEALIFCWGLAELGREFTSNREWNT